MKNKTLKEEFMDAVESGKKQERENWKSILDSDSCECDNCHRTRRYLKDPKKELHKRDNELQSEDSEAIYNLSQREVGREENCHCACHEEGVVNDCHYLNDNKCEVCDYKENKKCKSEHCESGEEDNTKTKLNKFELFKEASRIATGDLPDKHQNHVHGTANAIVELVLHHIEELEKKVARMKVDER